MIYMLDGSHASRWSPLSILPLLCNDSQASRSYLDMPLTPITHLDSVLTYLIATFVVNCQVHPPKAKAPETQGNNPLTGFNAMEWHLL